MKKYIEHLIKKGTLNQYLKLLPADGDRRNQRKEGEPSRQGKLPELATGILNTITTTSGSNVRKRKAREIASIGYRTPSNNLRRSDGSEIRFPHDDPLVITVLIDTMKRVLCNDGSNTDVLFASAFRGMKLKESKLIPFRTTTYGVGPEELPVFGCIEHL